ncbi:MAG: cellulase family glycosylhydrolase [Oscillospiraceae bacterium]|nr:cellulase family glycosylhydrolase [Oscillospiraceae bacterium]
MNKIYTQGMSFVDEHGRARIFNGANICSKNHNSDVASHTVFPYDLDDEFFQRYVSAGFNLIRLGVCWEELEPEMGVYNETFLKSVDEIFRRAEKWDVYIYLDMHQDLYGSFGKGLGDGAPKWAYLSEPYEPKPAKFVWAEGYFWGKAVHRAFDNFWDNKDIACRGVQDRFADVWKMLAARYKDCPALLGYDFLNEPFPGKSGGKVFRKLIMSLTKNILFNPKISAFGMLGDLIHKDRRDQLLDHLHGGVIGDITKAADKLIGEFDRERYSPFLRRVANAVREETDNGIAIFEHCYYSNLGIPLSVDPIEVNGKREKLQCYSPHGYDFTVDTPAYKFANNSRIKAFFDPARETQKRLNVPVIAGEWGGGGEGTGWFPHVRFLLDLFDSYQWSQTYWAFTPFTDDALLGELNRPYPVAVTGEIGGYALDRENRVFTLEYTQNEPVEAETVVYVPGAPAAVECGGEVLLTEENGADFIKIKTQPGKHKIVIRL